MSRGLLIALVLLANNIRDKEYDAQVGISTVATGKEEITGMSYFKALTVAVYLSTIILIALRVFSPFAVIALGSVPLAWKILKEFSVKVPLTSDMQTAQLALQFGVLLTLGELANIIYQSML